MTQKEINLLRQPPITIDKIDPPKDVPNKHIIKLASGKTVQVRIPPKVVPKPSATVAERLACFSPTKANQVQFPVGSLPDFRTWELCLTVPFVGGFSLESPVSPALTFQHFSIPWRLLRMRHVCTPLARWLKTKDGGWDAWLPHQRSPTKQREFYKKQISGEVAGCLGYHLQSDLSGLRRCTCIAWQKPISLVSTHLAAIRGNKGGGGQHKRKKWRAAERGKKVEGDSKRKGKEGNQENRGEGKDKE
ncbi:hypothetical protein PR048_012319 [Dryococelus australis]|uniref:Uncharacterized protein n=1 Tax=Dryococelus australis TaxID=614101 RepID=A0ABQ9HP09_9NEOP|nr:hypothetical protein PR048_012319 [Dryococelus australis]